jgi:hypothetical protein
VCLERHTAKIPEEGRSRRALPRPVRAARSGWYLVSLVSSGGPLTCRPERERRTWAGGGPNSGRACR